MILLADGTVEPSDESEGKSAGTAPNQLRQRACGAERL